MTPLLIHWTPCLRGFLLLHLFPVKSRRCILSEDEISDDASPGLRSVRRNMKITNDRIHTQLSGLVNGSAREIISRTL